MATLSIRQLTVRLGGRNILESLDLEVAEGEFLVLLGPSGCGKSTLLHAIAGLQEVASGQLLIDGTDHTRSEPKQRNVGMVFQSYALYPNMDVAGNLGFGLKARGLPAAEVTERVRKAAAMLQLEPLLARRPAQLSGGQRQRVAIGRALVRDARLFLLDEPLSNLDAGLRASLRRELRLLHQRLGATMIHVTHDQVEAMTLATRIAIMHEGRIEQIGAPDEVYNRPANRYVAAFLGSPGMNFIEGQLRAGTSAAARWRFESPGFALDLPDARLLASAGAGAVGAATALGEGRPVTLGLRPEQLELAPVGAVGAECEGTVTLVEPHGGHRVVWLDCAGTTLAVLDHDHAPDQALQTGAQIAVRCSNAAALLFDPANGLRL
jgi:multiple sugar transport system ATP-binding protein